MPLSIHGIHPIHARFRHVCCHFPGALYYFSFNGFSKVRFRSVWKGYECNVLACLRSEMRWFLGLFTSIADLGGVWLFRIHCQEAAVLRLSRLGCVTFFVYVLGLSSSPLGVPKVPLRPPANDRFLPRLSSDLGGIWLFRIHCQKAAVLRLSRLGCVTFFVYVLGSLLLL